MRVIVYFSMIVTLLMAFPTIGWTKPPSRDMYARAKGLYDSKRYVEAAAALGELYTADPDPWLLQKQALCYESMEQWEAALAAYQRIRTNHPNLEEKLDVFVVQAVARIENLLARPVSVSIVASVPGASVSVGEVTGVSPLVVDLKRAEHVARGVAPGYRETAVEFEAQTSGQVITLNLTPILVEVVLSHSAFDGDVTVTLDGQAPQGQVKQADHTTRFVTPPGERRIVCDNAKGQRAEVVLALADTDVSVQARCEPYMEAESWPAWLVLGAGVTATAAGTGLAVDALIKQADADSSSRKRCEGCTTQHIIGWTTAGVGVAAIVTSIFLFPEDADVLTWVPLPIPDTGQPLPTLVWAGSF